MPRGKKHRCCREIEADIIYKPVSIPMSELNTVQINLDEFEALRLCDYEGKDQSQAGERMKISRGTVQRLLSSARKKLIQALLNNDAILINEKQEKIEKY